MKKSFLFICLSLMVLIPCFCQQVITNPDYAFSTVNSLSIKEIALYDTCTIIDFEYSGRGGTYRIPASTYIEDATKPGKLFVKSAMGITIDEWVSASAGNRYKLVFPPIAKPAATIDYGEVGGDWFIYDIEIGNRNIISGVPEFQGKWFSTTGNLEYIFYDSVAIFNSDIWKYAKINKLKNIIELELNNTNEIKKIYFKIEPDNKASIGEDLNKLNLYSHNQQRIKTSSERQEWKYTDNTTPKIAFYSGYIKGFKPRYGFFTGQLIINNTLSGDQEVILIEINKYGQFKVKVPLLHPVIAIVQLSSFSGRIYLEPGIETFHVFDKKEAFFMGKLSFENESFGVINSKRPDYNKLMQLTLESPEQYRENCLNEYKNIIQNIDELTEKYIINPQIANLIKKDIQLNIYQNIMLYNVTKKQILRQKNNISGEQNTGLEKIKIPFSYFDFIRSIDFDDPSYLYSSEYFIFINYLCNLESLQNGMRKFPVNDLKDFLIKSNIQLKTEDLSNLSKIDSIQNSNENPGEDYPLYVNAIVNKHKDYLKDFLNDYNLKTVSNYLTDSFKINSPLLKDILKSQIYLSKTINAFKPYSSSELDSVCAKFSRGIVSSYIRFKNTEIINKIEANKLKKGYFVNETPKYEGSKIFNAIIEKYKGKVIYVDFWATWCGPCKDGIRKIAPLKEELAGEEIVFLYITGTTSPEGTWKNAIPDIKGEHFRLTNDEWNFICKEFDITGIPHYALVGKSGEIIKPNFERMSNEGLKKVLLGYAKE